MANELFQALDMFNKGATELATSRAIRGATEQAQMINMNEKDEFARRQQMQNLGNQLAMSLSAYGANPTQIQQSVGAIMPQQLSGPQDFFAAAQQATNPQAKEQLIQGGLGIQQDIAKQPMNEQQKAAARTAQYNAETGRMSLLNVGGAGSGQQKDLPPIPSIEIDKITKLENSIMNYDKMINEVQSNPEFTGLKNKFLDSDWLQNPKSRLDPDFARFRSLVQSEFDAYKVSITGAGATNEEMNRLERARPNVNDSPAQFQKKAELALQTAEEIRSRQLKNYGRGKYDVSGFSADPISSTMRSKMQTQVKQAEQQTLDRAKLDGVRAQIKNLSPDQQLQFKILVEQLQQQKK